MHDSDEKQFIGNENNPLNSLRVVDLGINTHQEPVVYMRSDCHVCRAEGFTTNSRVAVKCGDREAIATLNIVDDFVLEQGQAGLSKIALQRLKVTGGERIIITHAPEVTSLHAVRKKVFGHKLSDDEITHIISDISAHRYSDIEIASFLSVCAGSRLDIDEIIDFGELVPNDAIKASPAAGVALMAASKIEGRLVKWML